MKRTQPGLGALLGAMAVVALASLGSGCSFRTFRTFLGSDPPGAADETGRGDAAAMLRCPYGEVEKSEGTRDTGFEVVHEGWNRFEGCGGMVQCSTSGKCQLLRPPDPAVVELTPELLSRAEREWRASLPPPQCAEPVVLSEQTSRARWRMTACGLVKVCHATGAGEYECEEATKAPTHPDGEAK